MKNGPLTEGKTKSQGPKIIKDWGPAPPDPPSPTPRKKSIKVILGGITIPTNGHNVCMNIHEDIGKHCMNDACTAVWCQGMQVDVCGGCLKRKLESKEWELDLSGKYY